MKIIYRGITAHQDRVSSPMLRLLTEMNKFNFGQMCPLLHAAFDFTVKDLGRNLESKKAESGTATAVAAREDPNKPTVRTVFIRFLLSFFQFGTPSVKGDVLGQRALISPMFKYIKSDPALLVHDILEVLKTKVVNDSMVPRAVKTQVFNEWVLGHISALYTRPEPLREDGDQNKTVAVCVHEFLITICTKPGIGGVCFPDNGWYPQGSEVGTSGSVGQDGEKRQGQKIHNRTLAAFITGLKPFADTLQQDLLLEIFAAAPELVAGYFTSSSGGGSFTFEPKLTATWIGYCTFLTGLVRLPLPKGGFGLEGESVAQANPPPATTIVESILPRPCTKQILAKCVTFDNALVRFLATKFVVSAFNKLKKVIDAMDHAAAGFADGSVGAAKWVSTKEQLVEEFSRRVPDMATIVAAYNSTPVIKTGGGLHREVTSRLLMQYYELLPEVALGKRFDVNIALGGFLESGEGAVEEAKGMRLLEMEHLLGIAKEAGDVKWWNKSANMPHSSFTQVLKLCLNKPTTGSTTSITTSSSLTRVKEVLRAVIDQTRLFQEETVASPFEALLESLDTAKSSSPIVFKHILTFLDDCLVRCVRTPFKYLDDFAELLLVVKSQAPLSPIVMTLGEQAKFILESAESVEVKQGVALWLVRFLENLALAGENPDVIVTVCERLDAMATAAGVTDVVAISRAAVLNLTAWSEGKPLVKASERLSSAFHGVRAVFPAPGLVDLEKADAAIASVQNAETVITTYDLSVILKALSILLGSATTSQVMIEKVMDLLEMVVLRGKTYQDRFVGDMKRLVSADEKIVWALLWKGEGEVFDYFVTSTYSGPSMKIPTTSH
ncbi:ribosome 60S biogenesis N-terminal-domain-containing protein [Peziza echinospora]|nr:ribosome 60S biogenesis N-terminal-domain-containing protein [Peziza echinospora]